MIEGHVTDELTIGVDIGGTNFRAAVVDAEGTILDTEQLPTPSSVSALEEALELAIAELRGRHPSVVSVGLAVAGFIDETRTRVRFAPHLPWRHQEIVQRLSTRLGLPVVLEHDANSAAIGEHAFGAAQGVDNWVLFALGTGIGGAVMINGRIYRGAFGTAPEFGHLTVMPKGRACPCGKRGCLERYCSGSALALAAQDLMATRRYSASRLVDAYANKAEELTGRVIVDAARHGDALAQEAVDEVATWLGQGLGLVQDIFDPELIVIGGGLSTEADLFMDTAKSELGSSIVGSGYRPVSRVAAAQLGGDAGMIGVALLARQEAGERTHRRHEGT
ncbi:MULTISPECIES: ROK family protein [Corynebacterium]|uniref:ROK family protein n=1 Tax=Corynebacterium TaxID=1716 RepID=UPI0016597D98|nr:MULTISPECIES: ROK family protein [Corynebacterium]QNP92823.1 ROK family protein [Corynebacterium zhongnanshanii]